MMAETKLWNALKKAFEWKEVELNKIKAQKDNRTDKQKYLDKIEWMSEREKSLEYVDYVMAKLNDALYDINVKWLKDVMKYKMRNGIYKAVVKERKENWVIVSVGRIELDWETDKKKVGTLDYMIWNKSIDKSYVKWDRLYVSLNLDKSWKKNKLTVKEFILHGGDICSVNITNLSKKGAFVRVGKYEWFITNEQLEKFTDGKRKIKKWNKILMKIKKIRDNNKDKNKKWIIWDVVKDVEDEAPIVKMNLVKNWQDASIWLVA